MLRFIVVVCTGLYFQPVKSNATELFRTNPLIEYSPSDEDPGVLISLIQHTKVTAYLEGVVCAINSLLIAQTVSDESPDDMAALHTFLQHLKVLVSFASEQALPLVTDPLSRLTLRSGFGELVDISEWDATTSASRLDKDSVRAARLHIEERILATVSKLQKFIVLYNANFVSLQVLSSTWLANRPIRQAMARNQTAFLALSDLKSLQFQIRTFMNLTPLTSNMLEFQVVLQLLSDSAIQMKERAHSQQQQQLVQGVGSDLADQILGVISDLRFRYLTLFAHDANPPNDDALAELKRRLTQLSERFDPAVALLETYLSESLVNMSSVIEMLAGDPSLLTREVSSEIARFEAQRLRYERELSRLAELKIVATTQLETVRGENAAVLARVSSAEDDLLLLARQHDELTEKIGASRTRLTAIQDAATQLVHSIPDLQSMAQMVMQYAAFGETVVTVDGNEEATLAPDFNSVRAALSGPITDLMRQIRLDNQEEWKDRLQYRAATGDLNLAVHLKIEDLKRRFSWKYGVRNFKANVSLVVEVSGIGVSGKGEDQFNVNLKVSGRELDKVEAPQLMDRISAMVRERAKFAIARANPTLAHQRFEEIMLRQCSLLLQRVQASATPTKTN